MLPHHRNRLRPLFVSSIILAALACGLSLLPFAKAKIRSGRSGASFGAANVQSQTPTETIAKNGVSGATPSGGVGTTTIDWTIDYGLTSNTTGPLSNITLNDTWSAGQTLVPSSVKTPGGLWTTNQPNSTSLNFTGGLVAPDAKGITQPFPRPLGTGITFSGSGDGYNPVITANGEIMGVNHHSLPTPIWCFDMKTGAACPGYKKSLSVATGYAPVTIAIGNKIYFSDDSSNTAYGQTGHIYCWDSDTDASCGQSPQVFALGMALANGKFFTLTTGGLLDCYDPSNSLNRCGGFTPVNLGMLTGNSNNYTNEGDDLFAVGSKVFVANYQRKLTCFDSTTNAICSGWPTLPAVVNTAAAGNARYDLFPRLNATGAVTGICVAGQNTNATCYNLDSTSPTEVSMSATHVMSMGFNTHTGASVGTRVFFPNFFNVPGLSCWDWATNAPCTGSGFGANGITNANANNAYGLTTDGVNVFSFGDSGVLQSWNTVNGTTPSTRVATTATVNIDSFYCGSTSPVSATWDKVKLTDVNLTAGVEFTSLKISLVNPATGATVFGPVEALGTSGVFDVSAVSSSIRTLQLVADETPVGTVAWNDNVPPKATLTFKNNTPVQFCYRTTVSCSGSAQNHTDSISSMLTGYSATTSVTACALTPNLSVAKSAPSPSLKPGQVSTYTVTVTNNGSAPAAAATVKDGLPIGLDLVSASGSGWSCTPSTGTSPVGTVTCAFSGGTIPVGGTSSFSVVVQPRAAYGGSTVINYVSVDPTGGANAPIPTNCTGLNTPSAGCGVPVSSNVAQAPPNNAPVAYPQSLTTAEDAPVNITLTASDADNNYLFYSVGSPAHGTLTGAAPNLTYTPAAHYHGPDSFAFTVNDGFVDSNSATVSITVTPANSPPTVSCPAPQTVAATSPAGASADTTVQVSDPEGDALTLTWSVDGVAVHTDNLSNTSSPQSVTLSRTYALGMHTLSVSVTDGKAAAVDCSTVVTVQDATAPVISGLPGVGSLDWLNVATNGAPSARSGQRMVYDPVRRKVILFGGSNSAGYLNDVWEFDTGARTWTNVTPSSGNMPIPRANFAMAYDEARNKVVVYGGDVSTDYSNVGITGDTWEWDPAAHTWTQKPASTLRFVGLTGSAATYDPVLHQVVLFGGHPYWQFDDSGMWSFDGNDWVELSPANRPPGRSFHNMTTDRARNRVVLFGGYNGNLLGDTWEWDGNDWTQVATTAQGPGNRDGSGFAFDAARHVTVLFGGYPNLNDTWEWDGVAWKHVNPPTTPAARATSMVYDASQSSLVFFGGAAQADTWVSNITYTIIAEATGPNGAAVSWSSPTATDETDGTVPLNCSPASGSTFALGTSDVQCTAADSHGNTAHVSFKVKVQDTTPPVIAPQTDITTEATSAAGAVVNYSLTANDLVDGAVVVNCAPASGSQFSLGTTHVQCSATDSHGNSSQSTFDVTVTKATPTITWSNPADITYGTALSGTQLNATANVPGTFVYTPVAGTVLDKGAHSLHVDFTPTDTTTYNNASKDVSINVLSALLSTTMTVDRNPAWVGYNHNYLITISNNGNAAATGVTLSDPLPPATLVRFTAVTTSQGSCSYDPGQHKVNCALGTLAVGSTINIQLTTKSLQTGTLNNTATVSASQWDPATGGNTASVDGLQAITPVDLTVSKVDSADPIYVSQNVTYTMVVKNYNTPNNATGVVLTDNLPSSMQFVSATATQGNLVTPPVGSTGIVTANLGTLAPNATATITVTVKSTLAGTITNTANVMANETETNPVNNSASQTTTVNAASLQKVLLTKQVLIGGCENTTGNVYLTGPAPAGGLTVSLSTTSLAGVTVPASVFIPAGQTVSPAFTVTTSPVATKQVGLVNATVGMSTVSRNLTVNVGSGSCP